MLPTALLVYICSINAVAGAVFLYDKRQAMANGGRVSERALHLLELLGGIFLIVALILLVRHKSSKPRYWLVSLGMLVAWAAAAIFAVRSFG